MEFFVESGIRSHLYLNLYPIEVVESSVCTVPWITEGSTHMFLWFYSRTFGHSIGACFRKHPRLQAKFRRHRVVLLMFKISHKSQAAFPLVTIPLQMYSLGLLNIRMSFDKLVAISTRHFPVSSVNTESSLFSQHWSPILKAHFRVSGCTVTSNRRPNCFGSSILLCKYSHGARRKGVEIGRSFSWGSNLRKLTISSMLDLGLAE